MDKIEFESKIELSFEETLSYLNIEFRISRFEIETYVIIYSYDFLGRKNGNLFIFDTKKTIDNNIIIPDLNYFSKTEIINFCKKVIFNYKSHKYHWNSEKRKYDFQFKFV